MLSDKICLTIQIRMLNNVKPRDVFYLKFGGRLFSSLTILGLESKGGINSTVTKNVILYCRKFFAFVVTFIS